MKKLQAKVLQERGFLNHLDNPRIPLDMPGCGGSLCFLAWYDATPSPPQQVLTQAQGKAKGRSVAQAGLPASTS